ncbi:MAG TPA: hypothetical protein VIE44_07295 [Methylomirabilota bacterium]|jgi:hypothetical protein
MRERGETPGPSPAGPVPERLFRYLLDLEAEKALRLRYCVSLLCLEPDVHGPGARGIARQIARIVGRHLRQTDVAATLSGTTVGLLLVGAEPCTLSLILDRAGSAELPGSPRFACGARTVSVSGGGGCYPVTAPSAADLLRQATDLMRRARDEGGSRLLLPPLPAPVPA